MDNFILAFQQRLQEKYKNVEIVPIYPGGTLGVFFCAILDGKKRFVKTHLVGKTYQRNIQKEVEIMRTLYKGKMNVAFESIQICEHEQTFMMMDYLSKSTKDLQPETVRRCIEWYQKGLGEKDFCNYKLEDVIEAGWKSIELLDSKGFFTSKESTRIKESIYYVEQRLPHLTRVICHGDLSNQNIMCDESGKEQFAIDWEDSLLGFPEYDFLYWLTFFSQRKYYTPVLFEEFKIDIPFGVHVMALIVLVKCYLDYSSGSYKRNSLSFGQRLEEIYNILI